MQENAASALCIYIPYAHLMASIVNICANS